MSASDWQRVEIPDWLDGERVDLALARLVGVSRARAADLVANGDVAVEGAVACKSRRVSTGTVIAVRGGGREQPSRPEWVSEPVPVLFEDDWLVVVDKPIGVAAHPSPGWHGPTVIDGLRAAGVTVAGAGAQERQGIVHRLDVGTSGAMVVAKTDSAYSELKRQFRNRSVEKTYHALVQGHPDPSSGTVDAPIGRHPSHPHRFAVVTGGRDSVTHYVTLEAFRRASLLEVKLETGRTHQIRVHMAAMRHPCCGDVTYGADPTLALDLGIDRQWLHAVGLVIDHPFTGERIGFRSGYPQDLAGALAVCQGWQ